MFATISGGQVGVSVVGMIAGHGMRLRRGKAKKIAAAISRSPTAGMSNGVGTSPRHRSPKPPIATINAEIRRESGPSFLSSAMPRFYQTALTVLKRSAIKVYDYLPFCVRRLDSA